MIDKKIAFCENNLKFRQDWFMSILSFFGNRSLLFWKQGDFRNFCPWWDLRALSPSGIWSPGAEFADGRTVGKTAVKYSDNLCKNTIILFEMKNTANSRKNLKIHSFGEKFCIKIRISVFWPCIKIRLSGPKISLLKQKRDYVPKFTKREILTPWRWGLFG